MSVNCVQQYAFAGELSSIVVFASLFNILLVRKSAYFYIPVLQVEKFMSVFEMFYAQLYSFLSLKPLYNITVIIT